MKPRIALINHSAPYGTGNGQELLDMTLAAGSFGQSVSLFFIDDGVFQLVPNQAPESISSRNYSKTFSALPFYDVEDIYICKQSLETRHLLGKPLCIEGEIVDRQRLFSLINQHKHLVNL